MQAQVKHLSQQAHDVSVEVPQRFPAPPGRVPESVKRAMRVAARERTETFFNVDGAVTYVPVPVPAGAGAVESAEAYRTALGLKRTHLLSRFDVAHAHLALPTALACLRLGDSPLVVTEHQSTLRETLSERSALDAYAEVLERSDAFLCVSPTLKRTIVEFLGSTAEDKVAIVPNIVETDRIRFIQRERLDFRRWIYVGRLVANKGIHLLLKAFLAYVRNVDPQATLTLVGTGPMERWIRGFGDRHGLNDIIRLEGQRAHDQIGDVLAANDVLVHLSPYETFGLSSLEAIASGTPVVSLHNGGADDSWGDIENLSGVLMDVSANAEDVATAIADLRASSSHLDLKEARSTIEQRFSGEKIATALTTIYESVVP